MAQSSSQLRVFIVDDHDVIASSLAMILQFLGGFHATSFTDPLEALRASQFEAPDLLITDGDPLELSTQIKHLYIKGKEVELTSHQVDLYRRYIARP